MTECDHKTSEDHSRYIDAPGDLGGKIIVWKCSFCGDESQWTGQHEYFGKLECKICQMTAIYKVKCPNCKRTDELKVQGDE